MATSIDIPIYDESQAVMPVSGNTPFGFYDLDPAFQSDAPRFVRAAASRLGYGVTNIELQYRHFYQALEEAVTTYGKELYEYKIRENYMSLEGSDATTVINNAVIVPSLGTIIRLADTYGSEAGVGGTTPYYSASVPLINNQQVYDLNWYASASWGVSGAIEVKKVLYQQPPAIVRFFDPYAGTGAGLQSLMETFGFGQFSPGINFMLMPISYDVGTIQAIEFNDMIRKSNFSFNIVNNKLRIFPKPTFDGILWLTYIKVSERNSSVYSNTSGSVSNISNVPYVNVQYSLLNAPAKQWIYEYGYALCQEILGRVRQKFNDSFPSLEDTVGLNGTALITEASTWKKELIDQLRDTLNASSRTNQLQLQSQQNDAIRNVLTGVPLPIFVG